jgi:quercetin dioxygenase-like cupin family protein
MIYSQENISDNKFKRVFSSDVSEKELVWHMDKENRIVEVLEDTDWYFQMDNELPIEMKRGDVLEIKKNTYHRVIKGNGDLVIKITEK